MIICCYLPASSTSVFVIHKPFSHLLPWPKYSCKSLSVWTLKRILIFSSIGATGHIGGAVLDQISIKFPDTILTALVRDEEKAARLIAKYPEVIPKIGDLNSLEVLESCSKNADVVISKFFLPSSF
jgi:hypothetical protein